MEKKRKKMKKYMNYNETIPTNDNRYIYYEFFFF